MFVIKPAMLIFRHDLNSKNSSSTSLAVIEHLNISTSSIESFKEISDQMIDAFLETALGP